MRASAAALHSFGQTVMGLGMGSVLLGYLSDRRAAGAFASDYAAVCQGMKTRLVAPPAGCLSASATGLQHAMVTIAAFLVVAILLYLLAARSLRREVS